MHGTSAQHDGPAPSADGRALTLMALSATLHCLTGCAIGEVAGMALGSSLGFSNLQTVALAVALAFVFGYALTSVPLLRSGLTVRAVIPIALATDTFSIVVMEIVDNLIMLLVPGAMQAGIGAVLFWGALSASLVVAGAIALPVNRWLIARGRGHAVLHDTGHHPDFPVRTALVVAGAMAVFGAVTLIANAV